MKLSENALLSAIERATSVSSEEKRLYSIAEKTGIASSEISSPNDVIINYYFDDGENLYFYEETKDSKSLIVEEKAPISNESTNVKLLSDDIPNGIGGRVVVNNTTGNLFESKWKLPTAAELTGAPSEATYIYTGLRSSSHEVDANVTYNNASGEPRFRPRLCVKPNTSGATCMGAVMQPGYDLVHTSNGYALGATITTAFWRSYDDAARGIDNAVRLKTTGLAICANAGCSNTTDTNLINIIETNNINLTSQTYFKLLVTIAGTTATGKVRSTFSQIRLDGVDKTPVLGATDSATVSISGNSVTIIVDSTYPE